MTQEEKDYCENCGIHDACAYAPITLTTVDLLTKDWLLKCKGLAIEVTEENNPYKN